jgi:hypothetical protein
MIKDKTVFLIALMWFITIFISFLVLRETEYFRILSPVYLICMTGSIVTVRRNPKIKKNHE